MPLGTIFLFYLLCSARARPYIDLRLLFANMMFVAD